MIRKYCEILARLMLDHVLRTRLRRTWPGLSRFRMSFPKTERPFWKCALIAALAAGRPAPSMASTLAAPEADSLNVAADSSVAPEKPVADAAGAISPAAAPPAPPPAGAQAGDSVVVTSDRSRGSVIGDIRPTQTYNKSDVVATGATTIGEFLDAVAPETASGQGRKDNKPVVLVNGKRIAGIEDVAQIPVDAIKRVEVFPEELALKYGYRADQKVVNVILQQTFNGAHGAANVSAPTEGGFGAAAAGVNYLRIHFDDRVTFAASYAHSSALLESERDIIQPSGDPSLGSFRTLLPKTDAFALNGSYSTALPQKIAMTLSGRFEATNADSLRGLSGGAPVTYADDRRGAHAAVTLDGQLGRWLWNFTGRFDRLTASTQTVAAEVRQTRSVNSLGDARFLLSGAPLGLPAGPLQISVQGDVSTNAFTSRSTANPGVLESKLSRGSRGVETDIDVPIANRKKGVLSGLGELSLNANAAIEDLSDVGGVQTFGYGLRWSPIKAFYFVASETREDGAPTVDQLRAPSVNTPNVRLFDFTRNETVDAAFVFGGAPLLRADHRRVDKVALVVKPVAKKDFTVSAEYIRTAIDDPIAPFLGNTAEIEAAFPERFTRDASGILTQFDASPINFRRSAQQQFRCGFNFSRNLGSGASDHGNSDFQDFGSIEEIKALYPNAKITVAAPGSAEDRALVSAQEAAGSRFVISAHHTVSLEDEVELSAGGPRLDLLRGAVTDGTGGRPRHRIDLQIGVSKGGIGVRANATWNSATRLDTALAGNDLRYASLTRVDLRLFASLGKLGGSNPPFWLKTTVVTLNLENLLNERQEVQDSTGATPLSLQGAFLDPPGRVISLRITKQLWPVKPPQF